MGRRPNPLLQEFLDEDLPLPEIDWQTVPPGVNPMDAWDMFDENIEGWVPVWFPTGDLISGRTFTEFERAYFFNDDLERILKAMHRWPLWVRLIANHDRFERVVLPIFPKRISWLV